MKSFHRDEIVTAAVLLHNGGFATAASQNDVCVTQQMYYTT